MEYTKTRSQKRQYQGTGACHIVPTYVRKINRAASVRKYADCPVGGQTREGRWTLGSKGGKTGSGTANYLISLTRGGLLFGSREPSCKNRERQVTNRPGSRLKEKNTGTEKFGRGVRKGRAGRT